MAGLKRQKTLNFDGECFMCGRIVTILDPAIIARIFNLPGIPQQLPLRYNVAPSQQVAVVRQGADYQRQLGLVHWGFIPSWAKERKGHEFINARSESIAEKPTFRSAIRHKRCLIPSSGFYEWIPVGDHKVPNFIHMADNSIMTFAGVWDVWKTPEGELLETCAILTTAHTPNGILNYTHDRMPVILHPGEFDLWLDRDMTDPEKLKQLYQPYPNDMLEMYPVSYVVNNPKNDSPECIKPVIEILLVDDDEDYRTQVARLLMQNGFIIHSASSAEEAIRCL